MRTHFLLLNVSFHSYTLSIICYFPVCSLSSLQPIFKTLNRVTFVKHFTFSSSETENDHLLTKVQALHMMQQDFTYWAQFYPSISLTSTTGDYLKFPILYFYHSTLCWCYFLCLQCLLLLVPTVFSLGWNSIHIPKGLN